MCRFCTGYGVASAASTCPPRFQSAILKGIRKYIPVSVIIFLAALPLQAATRTWTGTVDTLWSNAANWGGAAPMAGDDLLFPAGAANLSNTNDFIAGTAFHSLNFSSGGYLVNGNQILLDAAGLTSAVGLVTLDIPVRLASSQTWTVSGGTLQVNGAIDLNGSTLTFASPFASGAATFLSGAVTGGGAIAQDGGSLTLSGSIGGAPINSRHSVLTLAGNLNAGALALDGVLLNIPQNVVAHIDNFRGGVGGVPTQILLSTSLATDAPGMLRVTGTVDLTNTFVSWMPADLTAIAPGTTYTIIDNDGGDAVVGNLVGLPNHSIIPGGGGLTRRVMVSYDGGNGNDVTLTVLDAGIATTTTIACSPNPAPAGAVVTCTASVTSNAGVPDGLVSFFAFPSQLGSIPVSDPGFATIPLDGNGRATIAYNGFNIGTHPALAVYHGTPTFGFSSGSANDLVITLPVPALGLRSLVALALMLAIIAIVSMGR